jgi:PAS domain S-box-containing protein
MSSIQLKVFAIVLLFGVLIGCILSAQIWRRRTLPAAHSFFVVIVAGTLWAFADAMRIFFPNDIWGTIPFLGIGALPVAWLAFCLEYTGRDNWLNKTRVLFLSLIPVLTIAVVATNSLHGWMWKNIQSSSGIRVIYGPWHLISSSYSYLLFLAGILLLLFNLAESSPGYRRQGIILLLAGLIPWFANLLQILDIYPRAAPNPTPLAFIVSSLVFFWGLFRLNLLEIMPVAQRVVIEQMADGLILLEAQNRIIQVNPTAEAMLNIRKSEVKGRPIGEVLLWPELLDRMASHDFFHEEVSLQLEGGLEYFDIKSSTFKDSKGRKLGRCFFIRNISQKKKEAIERERLLDELQMALAKVKTLSGLLPICAHCKKIRDDKGYWNQMELYIQEHSEAFFSHGLCPDCMARFYRDYAASP